MGVAVDGSTRGRVVVVGAELGADAGEQAHSSESIPTATAIAGTDRLRMCTNEILGN